MWANRAIISHAPLALDGGHRQGCKAGHEHNSRTSKYDERKKGWKRCEYPIFASRTFGRHFKRHNTGHWEFESARAVAAAFERTGSWKVAAQASTPAEGTEIVRVTIEDSIEAFLAKNKNRNIAQNTLAKYRTFTNQLSAYCADRGYIYADQLTVIDMDRFYATWRDGPAVKPRSLSGSHK